MPELRLVSLVPSLTELLASLRLEEEVVGITKFCVHPLHWLRHKTRIGGTKNINIPLIRSLQPTLIIANKEENVKEQVEALAKEFPVWVTDVNDLDSALTVIQTAGERLHKREEAEALAYRIEAGFGELAAETLTQRPTTAYFIWKAPYMAVGGDTFISDMLYRAGFQNIYGAASRYPVVELAHLAAAAPDYLFLSSEPYPFRQKHVAELQGSLPRTKMVLVDGEMFSWYGSRLLPAIDYFKKLRAGLCQRSSG